MNFIQIAINSYIYFIKADNEPVIIEEPFIPPLCNTCPGIQSNINCSCINDTYWSGSVCVRKEMCPCVEGLVR